MRHIGVDLSKRAFTACFLEEDDTQRLATFSMTSEGLEAFREHVDVDDRLALESGLNSYFFRDRIEGAVAEIVVVNPHQFAVISTSKKKTDRNDAIALARFLKLDCLPVVAVPARNIRELRQLFAARDALVKMSRQLKSIGHAALVRNGINSSRTDFGSHAARERLARRKDLGAADRVIVDMVLRELETVDRERDEIERVIIRTGKNLPGVKRLLQIRGLGLIAAIGVLVEIGGDVMRFPSAKHLASYAGLATSVHQSGATNRHGHITREGRRRLRGFMVEAVLSMIRNPASSGMPLVDFYRRKKQEKGAGKAICAAARKLLSIIFVLLTKGRDYWFLEERLYQTKLKALAAS